MDPNESRSGSESLSPAVVVSWVDLMRNAQADLIQIEYGFANGGEIRFQNQGLVWRRRREHRKLISLGRGALRARIFLTDRRLSCLGARWQSGLYIRLDRKIGRSHGRARWRGPGGCGTRTSGARSRPGACFLLGKRQQLSHDLGLLPFFCPLAFASSQRRQQEQGSRRQYCQGNHDGR